MFVFTFEDQEIQSIIFETKRNIYIFSPLFQSGNQLCILIETKIEFPFLLIN